MQYQVASTRGPQCGGIGSLALRLQPNQELEQQHFGVGGAPRLRQMYRTLRRRHFRKCFGQSATI